MVSRKITVVGVMGDYGTPAEVIRVLEEDKIDMSPIITHEITMDELREAMLHPEKLPGSRIKVVVKMA